MLGSRNHGVMIAMMALLFAGTAGAQTTTTTREAGTTQYAVAQATGEVIVTDGNALLVKMRPSGDLRWFNVSPDRKFVIDGQPKTIGQLAPGTVLTATVVTKTEAVNLRTTTVTNGTIVHIQGRSVSIRLDNGEVR